MNPRKALTPLVFVVLTAGAVLGVALDRGGSYLSAQATRAPKPEPVAAQPATDEALYQQIARQYEQFQHVNKTFELVARAVSPSVVHIVALKSGRSENGRRVREYEESGSGVIVRGDRGRGLFILTNNHVIEGPAAARSASSCKMAGRSIPKSSGSTPRRISRSSSSGVTICPPRGSATATRWPSAIGFWRSAARLA